jgi:tetratricopeptide (TPR) repeat protein
MLADSVHAILVDALRAHQSGDFSTAETGYLRGLASEPRHPDANRLLGTLYLQHGLLERARRYLQLATDITPADAECHNNLGAVLLHEGDLAGAQECFFRALAIRPDYPDALSNLGEAQRLAGNAAAAEDSLRRAVALAPGHANAHFNLGVLCMDGRRHTEARAALEHALTCLPGHFAAKRQLANLHILLGNFPEAELLCRQLLAEHPGEHEIRCALASILISARCLDAARTEAEAVLAEAPDHPRALVCRANILRQNGRPEEALGLFEHLAKAGQEVPRALGGIVDCQIALGRLDEALAVADDAIRRFPEEGLLHLDRGVALEKLSRAEEACESYRTGLRFLPDHPALHFNLGTQLLLLGRFEEGWREYEWRTRLGVWGMHSSKQWWRGEPLQGRPLVVEAEQGAGDTLQFVRLLTALAARGERIILECQAPLMRLLASAAGIAELRDINAGAAADPEAWRVSLLSLPGILGLNEDTIPAAVPYLAAQTRDISAWRERLGADTDFKVGIAWSGNPQHMNDANRSCPLAAFAPLFEVSGASFYSLQPGGGALLKAEAAARGVRDLTDAIGDFADTAALMMNLDLIVSVDTSVVHLAGALARPVWTLLPFAPDWRWQLGRNDSPWYPSMRLFRQHAPRDWSRVMPAAALALRERIDSARA